MINRISVCSSRKENIEPFLKKNFSVFSIKTQIRSAATRLLGPVTPRHAMMANCGSPGSTRETIS